jgi:hypothetical protein
MNKAEFINKLLWLGYTSAEEGTGKRKEAVSMAHNLLDEYLEAINYTHCCESDSEQLLAYTKFLRNELHLNITDTWVESYKKNSK